MLGVHWGLLVRQDREVQVGQEGVKPDWIKCHKRTAWGMHQVLPGTCPLQEISGWKSPGNPLSVVNAIVVTS
jgi:hypothetical protein